MTMMGDLTSSDGQGSRHNMDSIGSDSRRQKTTTSRLSVPLIHSAKKTAAPRPPRPAPRPIKRLPIYTYQSKDRSGTQYSQRLTVAMPQTGDNQNGKHSISARCVIERGYFRKSPFNKMTRSTHIATCFILRLRTQQQRAR